MPGEQPLETPRAMTLVEWGAMDDDLRGEFVDGQLVEEEEVGALHDVVIAWLVRVLGNWFAPRGGIVGVSDSTRFGLSPTRGRKPDAYVYFAGRPLPPADGMVTQPPDIMIEVVTPRPKDVRRDRIEKPPEYAAFGVGYYWIVDPGLRTLEIFELDERGRYVRALGAAQGVVSNVPGTKGFSLDLDDLWKEVERLPNG